MVPQSQPSDRFLALYNGRLKGLLSRAAHEDVAARLPVDRQWFLIDPQATPSPTCTEIAGETVREQIAGLVDELQPLHGLGDGTGWTFVAEVEGDWTIKVFNPRQCGSGCGWHSPTPWRVYCTVRPSATACAAIAPPPPDAGRFEAFAQRARGLLGR